MKKSDQLKQQRAAKITSQGAMLETRKAQEGNKFTDEQRKQFETLNTEIEALDAQIRTAESDEAAELRAAEIAANAGNGKGIDSEKREKDKLQGRFSISKALRSKGKLDGAEKEINDIALEEARNNGTDIPHNAVFTLPGSMMRADQQSATLDAAAFGGALIQGDTPRLVENFMPKLWLEEAGATVLSGLKGNVTLPTPNNYNFEWLAEGANITSQKQGFAGPKLAPRRAGAQVPITNQLLIQSSVDVDALIMRKLGQGAARALNAAAINGDNANNEPQGILNTVGISEVGTVAGAATWAKLVALSGQIEQDDATENSLRYLMDPATLSALKTISKDAGSGRFIFENGVIDGKQVISTSLMPELATNKVIAYGDFSQLFIGLWGGTSFIVDPYTQAGADSVQITVNMHADVAIANPKAFAVDKFITI